MAEATKKPKPIYNNKRFKPSEYNFDMFIGPRAGDPFQDFTLTDLQSGAPVKLSDFNGKWVVVETASSTCSMYTKNIPDMKDIAEEMDDVEFVVVYVREAHPGERLAQHKDMAEKIAAAKIIAPRYGEHRRVLVDNYEGDFHRAYGAMPNVVYIIRPDGKVHYRCNWAAPHKVKEALEDRENFHTVENADLVTLRASRKKLHMFRTMWTGGIIALYDFLKGAPYVVGKHMKVDSYYNKHGKFKNQPEDLSESPAPAPTK
jgi:peroxiredoxin